jgi:hypothetical protein
MAHRDRVALPVHPASKLAEQALEPPLCDQDAKALVDHVDLSTQPGFAHGLVEQGVVQVYRRYGS